MNKKTKLMIYVAGLVVVLPGLFGDVSHILISNEKKNMPRVKIENAVEVVNKYNNYVNVAPSCPSGAMVPSNNFNEETEFDHCKECQMGVYFKKNEEELECSFCLKIRKA